MSKLPNVRPMSELAPIISELVSDGTEVTIIVTGNSMRPMLTSHKDTVRLTACNPEHLKKGDIPLYKRDDGNYVLHRIIKVHKDCFDISGDRQTVLEKGVPKTSVICVVKSFTRNGKEYSCRHLGYRTYAFLWRVLFPLRKPLIKMYKFFK